LRDCLAGNTLFVLVALLLEVGLQELPNAMEVHVSRIRVDENAFSASYQPAGNLQSQSRVTGS